jgi:hypothetical protein
MKPPPPRRGLSPSREHDEVRNRFVAASTRRCSASHAFRWPCRPRCPSPSESADHAASRHREPQRLPLARDPAPRRRAREQAHVLAALHTRTSTKCSRPSSAAAAATCATSARSAARQVTSTDSRRSPLHQAAHDHRVPRRRPRARHPQGQPGEHANLMVEVKEIRAIAGWAHSLSIGADKRCFQWWSVA